VNLLKRTISYVGGILDARLQKAIAFHVGSLVKQDCENTVLRQGSESSGATILSLDMAPVLTPAATSTAGLAPKAKSAEAPPATPNRIADAPRTSSLSPRRGTMGSTRPAEAIVSTLADPVSYAEEQSPRALVACKTTQPFSSADLRPQTTYSHAKALQAQGISAKEPCTPGPVVAQGAAEQLPDGRSQLGGKMTPLRLRMTPIREGLTPPAPVKIAGPTSQAICVDTRVKHTIGHAIGHATVDKVALSPGKTLLSPAQSLRKTLH
jgi:hypothetical protein